MPLLKKDVLNAYRVSIRIFYQRRKFYVSDWSRPWEQEFKDYELFAGSFRLYGEPELTMCETIENGIIILYNQIRESVSSEFNVLLEEVDIDDMFWQKRKSGAA